MSYQGCIADLLGPKARAMGCRCECPACTAEREAATKPTPPDWKRKAANDEE